MKLRTPFLDFPPLSLLILGHDAEVGFTLAPPEVDLLAKIEGEDDRLASQDQDHGAQDRGPELGPDQEIGQGLDMI